MSWAAAYARQAKSDLDAREQLLSLNPCHQLHYLQMAAEKLCKAHLSSQGQPQSVLETSHAFIAGPLPVIVRQIIARDSGRSRQGWLLTAIRKLTRQIELLHPQVDDGGRTPANCIYPWEGPGRNVIAPVDHPFGLNLLHEQAGTTLLKIMRTAIDELIAEGDDLS
ncbi:MAG: hypothetical protein ABFD92_11280 [Planctomycetaceae bacterium]|nr:hypothetical protein [Planctomycetaceae bacterium]